MPSPLPDQAKNDSVCSNHIELAVIDCNNDETKNAQNNCSGCIIKVNTPEELSPPRQNFFKKRKKKLFN